MITITTMRIVWLLRAETTTTTMLRLSSACVLRFTRSQNSVSFPVFAKLFAQTSICELIDLSMKGLTILPFIFLQKAKQTRPFCNGFSFVECAWKSGRVIFLTKVQLRCSLVELYLIFTLAYVISSLSRNLRLCLYKNWLILFLLSKHNLRFFDFAIATLRMTLFLSCWA